MSSFTWPKNRKVSIEIHAEFGEEMLYFYCKSNTEHDDAAMNNTLKVMSKRLKLKVLRKQPWIGENPNPTFTVSSCDSGVLVKG